MGNQILPRFDLMDYRPSVLVRLMSYAAFGGGTALVFGFGNEPWSAIVAAAVSIGLVEALFRIDAPAFNSVCLTGSAVEIPPFLSLPPMVRRGRGAWPPQFINYASIRQLAIAENVVTLTYVVGSRSRKIALRMLDADHFLGELKKRVPADPG